jgi:hypothetical protein
VELQEKKQKKDLGGGGRRVLTRLEGNGAPTSIFLVILFIFSLTKCKPNHPNIVRFEFYSEIGKSQLM